MEIENLKVVIMKYIHRRLNKAKGPHLLTAASEMSAPIEPQQYVGPISASFIRLACNESCHAFGGNPGEYTVRRRYCSELHQRTTGWIDTEDMGPLPSNRPPQRSACSAIMFSLTSCGACASQACVESCPRCGYRCHVDRPRDSHPSSPCSGTLALKQSRSSMACNRQRRRRNNVRQ